MLRFTNQLVKKAGTNYASNQKAALFIGGLSKVKAKSMNQQQRPFIEKLKTMVDYVSKGNSPNAVDGMKDRKQLVSYFRSISLSHPKECIEQIHSGWQNGKVPANEDVIREYLKAAAVLKKLDTMDLNGLLSLASKERQLAGASSGISPEAFYAAMNANKTFGSTSTDPIYIKSEFREIRFSE